MCRDNVKTGHVRIRGCTYDLLNDISEKTSVSVTDIVDRMLLYAIDHMRMKREHKIVYSMKFDGEE